MRVEELRIGNLIETTYGLSIVFGITKDGLVQVVMPDSPEESIFDFDLDKCGHISLTEEWLERLGLGVNDELKILEQKIDNKEIALTRDGVKIEIHTCRDADPYDKRNDFYAFYEALPHIKFVHQLQNLYFALTNQELTIKHEQTQKA